MIHKKNNLEDKLKILTIRELKSQLSEVLGRLKEGQEIIIS